MRNPFRKSLEEQELDDLIKVIEGMAKAIEAKAGACDDPKVAMAYFDCFLILMDEMHRIVGGPSLHEDLRASVAEFGFRVDMIDFDPDGNG